MAKQPSYPVKEMRSYVRESDNIVCYYPICIKPKEVFVEQARAIWGDRYDYTESNYTNNKQPITIRCKKHDCYFTVGMAQNHLMKHNATGCPVCRYEQQHGKQYGPEWRETLRLSPKQNRVGLIYHHKNRHVKSPEQRAAEKAEREAKAEAKRREERAYMDQWQGKSIAEANFKKRMNEKYGDHYTFEHMDYKGSCRTVTITCKYHGDFNVEPREILTDRTTGLHLHRECPVCEGREVKKRMTDDEFFQRMHQLYDATELDFLTSEFNGKNKKVTAYCRKHGPINHTVSYWLDGKGCEYCNGQFYPPDFLRLARKKHGDKYQYRGIKNIKSSQSYIKIHCDNPDHHWHSQRVDLHLQGFGCVECSNYPNKKTPQQRCDEWIKKCIKKYGEGRYDYSRAHEDYVNNDSLVWIRCCIHDHWFQQTPDNNLRTVNGSCPICSIEFRESEGEAEIRRWLLKHGITNFKQDEVTLPVEDPRCKRQYLRPDFWLPDYNLFIEYNGEQHYEDIEYFHTGGWTLEDQQIRDEAVRRYCHDHHHRLLEIPYTDFDNISEILAKTLLKKKAKV
jgi:hypothetical protein